MIWVHDARYTLMHTLNSLYLYHYVLGRFSSFSYSNNTWIGAQIIGVERTFYKMTQNIVKLHSSMRSLFGSNIFRAPPRLSFRIFLYFEPNTSLHALCTIHIVLVFSGNIHIQYPLHCKSSYRHYYSEKMRHYNKPPNTNGSIYHLGLMFCETI